MYVATHATARVTENKLQVSILSFYHVLYMELSGQA